MARSRTRISGSFWVDGFRFRVSTPLTGGGQTWVSVGHRILRGWLGVSAPVSRAQRGRRSR